MPPHEGLVHPKEYDVKDSNVELIGSDIDHQVKYNSAATEPAWNDGKVGKEAGLHVWRIEEFEVIAWPKDKYGLFYNGDSYIVLYSYQVGDKEGQKRLAHDIFFWLGIKTSQDEAGTAAYKTVELDEFLHGTATQHREIQQQPSEDFLGLFPRIYIRSGGVRSGFRHVDTEEKPQEVTTLLRIFKVASASRSDSVMVHEVPPTWESLDEDDVFVLEKANKIWVWQGKKCSPMEKAKAAQVVADLTQAKHKDTEVLSQAESRSHIVIDLLGGNGREASNLRAPKPISSSRDTQQTTGSGSRKLWRLSDASGELSFNFVKDGASVQKSDFDSNDVFILDDGKKVWVWEGSGASHAEKAIWLKVAQAYVRSLQEQSDGNAYLRPISKVVEGNESPAFVRALAA
jgi:gelsolin